jgi:hypothetical protein
VGLRLGNRSWHSTLDQAGAQNSQSPVDANAGTVMEPSCSSGFRRRRSLLLTSRKLMIGQLGRPCLCQVPRAIPTVRRRLPLHPDKQIVTEPMGTLHSCQQRTHAPLGRRAIIVPPREAELSSREVVRYLQSLPSKETCYGIDPHCRCFGAAVWRRRILRSPQGALVEFSAAASDRADAPAANKRQLRYLN